MSSVTRCVSESCEPGGSSTANIMRPSSIGVMASGFIGFAMGTTANAVANMRSLVARFGPAPRAFLVIPLVGAFFIDFANALIVTSFVNWLK